MTHFELDDCTNCRANRWEMCHRQKDSGRTEFKCVYCANIVIFKTTLEQFRVIAGDA